LQLEDGSTVELDIASWTQLTKSGDKWLSLTVKPKATGRQVSDNSGRERFNPRVQEMGAPIYDIYDIEF
jgi:hypothetical protein